MKHTYAGIPAELAKAEKAAISLRPIAYDGTSTWGKGADNGPEAFLNASENMELYDIETDSEVYQKGIYMPGIADLRTLSPEDMYRRTLEIGREAIAEGKFPTFFGGEHSVSIGLIDAFMEKYANLTVLQIDAHADLRPTYEGTEYNHACAMYRASQKANLIQVGIRSMDAEELDHTDREQTYFAHDIVDNTYWMQEALKKTTSPVYITFDLDAFDPSIMPATGTPEPGGLDWYSTIEFLRIIFSRRNVVGFDIVELCPDPHSRASNMLAAKLYYKMLTYKFFA